jgi:diguanylate cyclase (GGDEF)-like protein
MLDPLSAFIFAMLFSLLNGGVLGFMHRALTPDLQPSATDWRIGTLLVAGGAALFVGQAATSTNWVLPIANACWLFGLALYWRAVRRFFNLPDSAWIYAPAVAGTLGNALFVFALPSVANRVVVATVCWVVIIFGSALTLLRNRHRDRSTSAMVLTAIFIGLGLLMLLRGVYFLVAGNVVISIAQPLNWVNALTPLLIAVLPVIGTTAFVLLCFERIRRELQRMATTDMLTGLPNRLNINERAAQLFVQARAGKRQLAVAIIDIDHFKSINDRHGHDAGDLVLQDVARTLASACGEAGVTGRQGGEEFVALFANADVASALACAERMRTAVARSTCQMGGTGLTSTVSIGVAAYSAHDLEFADVLRRADRALYAAKSAGRNCVRFEAVNGDAPPQPALDGGGTSQTQGSTFHSPPTSLSE